MSEKTPQAPAAEASRTDQPEKAVAAGEPQRQQHPVGEPTQPPAIARLYMGLHDACGAIVRTSLQAAHFQQVAESHIFLLELERWATTVEPGKEGQLLSVAAREYQLALLALTQGQYRQAFKGLRLVLELCLQAVHLSAHQVELQEWLEGRKDTVWNVLVDENNGVLSVRFARAFFPDLEADVRHHRSLAEKVYRECSECVHGSAQKCIPLPESLVFSPDAFALWHQMAKSVALLTAFALTMRYLKGMTPQRAEAIEHDVMGRLGHMVALRRVFGGPEGG